jgi:cyclic-di-GMP-binding protein
MPSFDTVLEADFVEVKNAVDQVAREIGTRFDFKGTSAAIELKDTKRGVDARFLDVGKVEKVGGDKVKQVVKVRNGVSTEDGKKIQQAIKGSKLKVQGAIQGDAVRVTGAKRDDLQAAMALIKSELKDLPLSFNNFRD